VYRYNAAGIDTTNVMIMSNPAMNAVFLTGLKESLSRGSDGRLLTAYWGDGIPSNDR
jgi:hypothetical protein